MPAESDATAVRNLLGQAGVAAYSYAPPRRRAEIAEMWQRGLGRLLAGAPGRLGPAAGAGPSVRHRGQPGMGRRPAAAWWSGQQVPDGLVVDADLRWLLVANLSRLGRLDEAAIAAEERRDPSITGAEQAAGARAAQPNAPAKAEAWRLAVEADDIPNPTHTAICVNFWLRGQDELLLPYVEPYLAVAEDISALRGVWADKAASLRKNVLRLLFPWPLDKQALLDRLDPWLADRRPVGLGTPDRRGASRRHAASPALPVALMG